MTGLFISALGDIRSKPFRTFAAIAGMVAAVIAVVLVDAAGVFSHDANAIFLARQFGRPVTYSITVETASSETYAELETRLSNNGFSNLSIDQQLTVTVVDNQNVVGTSLRWVNPAYSEIRVVDTVEGEWPDVTARSDVLHGVVTEGWAQNTLGISDADIVGHTFRWLDIRDRDFDPTVMMTQPIVIDAVVSSSSLAFRGSPGITIVSSQSPTSYMPVDTVPTWLVRVNEADAGMLTELVHSLTDADGASAFAYQRADQADELAPVLRQQDVTGRIVKIVALAVGGLGVFGVGIASVRERAVEFGLRRALGANRNRIFLSVLLQTVMEAMLAAAVALPAAALLMEAFARQLVLAVLPLPPSTMLPIQSAMQGLLGALAVGLVAGLLPAVSAARSSVVQALRG